MTTEQLQDIKARLNAQIIGYHIQPQVKKDALELIAEVERLRASLGASGAPPVEDDGGFATLTYEREEDGRVIAILNVRAYGVTQEVAAKNAAAIGVRAVGALPVEESQHGQSAVRTRDAARGDISRGDDSTPSGREVAAGVSGAAAPRPDKFEELKALPDGWDSYGAPALDKAIVDSARQFLQRVSVVPCSDGGVQLEWHTHGIDMEIEFEPDGRLGVYIAAVAPNVEVSTEGVAAAPLDLAPIEARVKSFHPFHSCCLCKDVELLLAEVHRLRGEKELGF